MTQVGSLSFARTGSSFFPLPTKHVLSFLPNDVIVSTLFQKTRRLSTKIFIVASGFNSPQSQLLGRLESGGDALRAGVFDAPVCGALTRNRNEGCVSGSPCPLSCLWTSSIGATARMRRGPWRNKCISARERDDASHPLAAMSEWPK